MCLLALVSYFPVAAALPAGDSGETTKVPPQIKDRIDNIRDKLDIKFPGVDDGNGDNGGDNGDNGCIAGWRPERKKKLAPVKISLNAAISK